MSLTGKREEEKEGKKKKKRKKKKNKRILHHKPLEDFANLKDQWGSTRVEQATVKGGGGGVTVAKSFMRKLPNN